MSSFISERPRSESLLSQVGKLNFHAIPAVQTTLIYRGHVLKFLFPPPASYRHEPPEMAIPGTPRFIAIIDRPN